MLAPSYSIYITANDFLSDGYYGDKMACTDTPIGFKHNLTQIDAQRIFTSAVNTLSQPLVNLDIYTDSVGKSANVTVFLTTTTAPEVVLTVATLTGGGKQDVVVEGSLETASLSTSIYRNARVSSTPHSSSSAIISVTLHCASSTASLEHCSSCPISRILLQKKRHQQTTPQHLYDEVTLRSTVHEILVQIPVA
ncbi:hypothetical protein GBAR_LOCUS11733 [Geodia barretti]|uniref:Uncharacterized protein n=1 Tax=Geodia barretti TaxID=519541 RepID=A0AA35WJL0_GEOBA|nr:hypothetical protein GBAR_LOCUS11733 [Geodia barretti]